MIILEKVANQSQLQFYGGLVFFVPLQEQFSENAYNSCL